MSAKNDGYEVPKQHFLSSKTKPAPAPPTSKINVEYVKNVKSKNYTHYKHTRQVTEDERIYETITTSSNSSDPNKRVIRTSTTQRKDLPQKRYFDSDVRLLNVEDSLTTSHAKDEKEKINLDEKPLNRSTANNSPTLTNSTDSIYKTAVSSIADFDNISIANLSINSIVVRKASPQFDAEFEKLLKMQSDLIAQFNVVDQLRKEKMASRTVTPPKEQNLPSDPNHKVMSIRSVTPSVGHQSKAPSRAPSVHEEVRRLAAPNYEVIYSGQASKVPSRAPSVHEEVRHVAAPNYEVIYSGQASKVPSRAPSVKSIGVYQTKPPSNAPSVKSVHEELQHLEEPNYELIYSRQQSNAPSLAPWESPAPSSVKSVDVQPQYVVHSEPTIYVSVPNEWHTVDQYNPVHHAEILDKKKEADYESIKSEPHRAVEYLNKDKRRSSAASDAKSNEYESIKSVNTAKKSSSSDKGEELGHQVAMLDSSFEHIYHTPIIITHLNKDETSRPQIPPPIPPFGAKKLRPETKTYSLPDYQRTQHHQVRSIRSQPSWDDVMEDIRQLGQKKLEKDNQ